MSENPAPVWGHRISLLPLRLGVTSWKSVQPNNGLMFKFIAIFSTGWISELSSSCGGDVIFRTVLGLLKPIPRI